MRREFSKVVKVDIIKRSIGISGFATCEKCGLSTHGRFEIHHVDQDAMQIDKGAHLTAKDGILLCIPCHKEITVQQAPVLAKVKRVEARHLGATTIKVKIPSRPKQPRVEKAPVVGMSEIARRMK